MKYNNKRLVNYDYPIAGVNEVIVMMAVSHCTFDCGENKWHTSTKRPVMQVVVNALLVIGYCYQSRGLDCMAGDVRTAAFLHPLYTDHD